MSDATIERSDKRNVSDSRVGPSGSALPTWWLVFTRELADLWIGGKALNLILIYGVLLGVITYVMATNSELSLIPPKEMVYETLKNAMAVSLFIGLIIGADSLSGERERATLEGLLLTQKRLPEYDYVVVNHDGQAARAAEQVRAIITAERHRTFPRPIKI